MTFDHRIDHRSEYLDVLRGLAILGVVTVHSAGTVTNGLGTFGISENIQITDLFNLGGKGVILFFCISGFLLETLYASSLNTKQYIVRRFARIFPLWIVFFFLFNTIFIFARLSSPEATNEFRLFGVLPSFVSILILAFTFTSWTTSLWGQIIPGSWSIESEVAHYIAYPFAKTKSTDRVLVILSFLNVFSFALSMGIGFIYGQSIFLGNLISSWLHLNFFATFGFFFLGVMAARVYRKMESGSSIMESLPCNPKIFSLWILTATLGPLNFARVTETFGFLVVSLLAGSYIMGTRILKRLFVFIGNRSYFIYFFHFIILAYASKVFTQINNLNDFTGIQFTYTICLTWITLVLSLPFSEFSKRYFEGPLMRLARKVK